MVKYYVAMCSTPMKFLTKIPSLQYGDSFFKKLVLANWSNFAGVVRASGGHPEWYRKWGIVRRITDIMGKIKGLWRRDGNDAQNGASLAAIRVWNGAPQTVIDCPGFSSKSGEIMDNISPSGGIPFQTLIAAKDSPFWASFPALLQRP